MQSLAYVTHITIFQPVSLNDMKVTQWHNSCVFAYTQIFIYKNEGLVWQFSFAVTVSKQSVVLWVFIIQHIILVVEDYREK